jgi:hypothetical protein
MLLLLALSPNTKRFWLVALGLMLFPYYYFCSTFFSTDMTALTFILLGLTRSVFRRVSREQIELND